ncbi:MAG: hypothetical protein IJ842_00690 [Bacilli bacterium]|nr:hypothetical protein [Bacilli bacterium]
MNCSENNCSSCIFDILKKILVLQKQDFSCENYVGCDKPFLGPSLNTVCYNTRPIQLYICSTGTRWTFDYTLEDGTTGTSSVLRVEALDDCCCTCRILYLDDTTNQYLSTNQFVTIDLKCCGAIRCLNDINVDLC